MLIRVAGKNIWLNYHHLYYFKTIAELGSISNAAKVLRLGEPTLSAQIKQFEGHLGMKLFERKHKKLILNETGKLMEKYAKEIFRLGSEMVEVIFDHIPESAVHFQLGALDSIPKNLILSLSKYAILSSGSRVTMLEGKMDELIEALLKHQLDLVVSNFVPLSKLDGGLIAKSLGRQPILVRGSSKFKKLHKGFPQSLHSAPMILSTRHSKFRQDIDDFFNAANIDINVVAETQDTAIQKLMGIDGLGLVPLSCLAAKDLIQKGDLIAIGTLPDIYEEYYLISANRKIANPIAKNIFKNFRLSE